MKKVSYIHAEAYPAGEMKHGPIALISDGLPVVVIATCNWDSPSSRQRYERTLSNIKEAKARGATIIALVTEGDREVRCHGRPPGGPASHQRDSLHHPGSGPPSTPCLPHRRACAVAMWTSHGT